jgi:hypothetical protein
MVDDDDVFVSLWATGWLAIVAGLVLLAAGAAVGGVVAWAGAATVFAAVVAGD